MAVFTGHILNGEMFTVLKGNFAKDPPFLKTPPRKNSLRELGKKEPRVRTKYEAIA